MSPMNRHPELDVDRGMNRRRPLPPRLGRLLREYGLAVGIAIGAMIGLAFGNAAIGVAAGIPIGAALAS
jgi:hypothetical protein